MKTKSTTHAALALVALAGILGSTALTAESVEESAVPSLEVDYTDLDLTSAQGVQALHRRLTAAAERVCPRTDGRVSVQDQIRGRECRKQVLDRAVRDIGSAELATLHAATTTRG